MLSTEIPADTQLALYTMFGNLQRLLECISEENYQSTDENYDNMVDTLPEKYRERYHELHQVSPINLL